jgi:uncharacterized repeat protein (TIGR03803 family)
MGQGCGTVFKLDTAAHEHVLYSFKGHPDGTGPVASLTRDPSGNLYGATLVGGEWGRGTVFKVDPAGHETVLYSFNGGMGGYGPYSGVIRDQSGSLYGTAPLGGALGRGVVFNLGPSGNEIVLHTFAGPDGKSPGDLIRDPAGNLYGTTPEGGIDPDRVCFGNCGLVFKLDAAGNETVLHYFTGADGDFPVGMIRDDAGNFYGVTKYGGQGYGVVFKLDSTGKETVLYTFKGLADGTLPLAGVVRDAAGNLYGTASGGGAFGYGVVYKIAP